MIQSENSGNERKTQAVSSDEYGMEDIRDWKFRQLLNEFNKERSAAMQVGQEAPLLKLTVERGKPCPCARQLAKIRINPVAPLEQQAGRLPPFPQCPQRCEFCHIEPTVFKPKGPGIIANLCGGVGRLLAFLLKFVLLMAVLGGIGFALWFYQPWKLLNNNLPAGFESSERNTRSGEKSTIPPENATGDGSNQNSAESDTVVTPAKSVANQDSKEESGALQSEPKSDETVETTDKKSDGKTDNKTEESDLNPKPDANVEIPSGYRLWTDENGNRIVAKFIKYQLGLAYVQEYKTDETVKIPLKALTDADKDYIKPLIKK